MKKRDWSQADLSRISGISPSQISRVLMGERGFGEETLKNIAEALQLPIEIVYRAAGLLPAESEDDILDKTILYLAKPLSRELKEEIVEYIKMQKKLAEGKSKYATRKNKHRTAPTEGN